MQVEEMALSADRISELLKSLAAKSRLLILCQLASGEKSVGELASLLDANSPAISQQLALLRKENLVASRRDGQTIYYSIDNPDALRLLEFLHETFCTVESSSVSHRNKLKKKV